jgi:uncharacterized protein (TIGR01777 family)
MKVIVAGGSGFIGAQLGRSLLADGHEVVVLTRGQPRPAQPGVRFLSWDARTAAGSWVSELSSAQAIVNLAGASIGGGRWTRSRMNEILSSRLAATTALIEALRQVSGGKRPSVLVSASGIDYYGNRGDEVITEESGPGHSFLALVSQQWEAAAQPAAALGIRVVLIRTSLVFGRKAPAFRLLTVPFRLFVGGPLGNGRQWFTWVHLDDHVRLYRLALEEEKLSGPINSVAPDVRPQREVAREIGAVLHRPSWFPAPAPLLRLALGRQSELLLDGRRARPARAEALGFRFRFGELRPALENVLSTADSGRRT